MGGLKDIVEKVARALCGFDEKFGDPPDITKQIVDSQWPGYAERAKAAIHTVLDAISEPSEAMHHEARDWSYLKYGKPIGRDASDGCWRAMLAALRKEIGDV